MKQWYKIKVEDIIREEGISLQGLTDTQAAKIREEAGENTLTENKKISTLQVFLGQFKDFLVIILIAAALISMFSGHVESTIVIISVIIFVIIRYSFILKINKTRELDIIN